MLDYKSRGIYRKSGFAFERKHVAEECEVYEIIVSCQLDDSEKQRSLKSE